MTFAQGLSIMVTYDWKKIQRIAKRDPKKVIKAMRVISGQIPTNKYDELYPYYLRDFRGKSYLVNPKELLDNDYFYKAKDIAEYIALASYRNYSVYLTTGDASLDLLHSPVSIATIKNNRLLSIENGKILFKYEEVTKEK